MKKITDYAELVKAKHALNKTIAPVETDLTNASQAYAVGAKFIYDGTLYKAKTAIAQHDALVLNTNYVAADDLETQITNEAATRSAMGAKNLVPYPYYNGDSRDTNGILFTVNSDGSITISGEATADAYFRLTYNTGDAHVPLQAGKSYILSASGKSDVAFLLRDTATTNVASARATDATYACTTAGDYDVILCVDNGANYSTAITVYPMLRLATDSNSDYQPYAKTNKELTDNVSSLNSAIANKANTADVVPKTDIVNNLTETTTGKVLDATQGKALNDTISNSHKVSTFEVSTSSWTQDTTSQSGTTLQKKAISLSHVYVDSPLVKIGAASGSVLPTTAQQTAYDLVQYATLDGTTLYLYASDVPTDAFYINVEGVD